MTEPSKGLVSKKWQRDLVGAQKVLAYLTSSKFKAQFHAGVTTVLAIYALLKSAGV